MQITTALCDDDGEQIKNLRSLISEWSADKPFRVNIYEYESCSRFMFEYPDNPCDLLLLDIEMDGINGMELAKKLRARGDMLPIIFITGYADYISEGYDVEALHYLLKPVEREKLFAVLDKYVRRRSVKPKEILISDGEKSTHVPIDSIVSVEAFGRKTRVTLSDGTEISCGMNIGCFENIGGLIHCHRSYIVNLRCVKSIGRTVVYMDSGAEIPLSRRLYNEVNKSFIEFYTKQ